MSTLVQAPPSTIAGSPERPLRVCHLAYTFYENDNRVLRYAELLASQGAVVDVISLRRPGQGRAEQFNGVRVHRIQRRRVSEKRQLTYLLKLAWFWCKALVALTVLQLRRRYDLVHVHNVPDFLVFAAVVPKLMGARIILDIHDILPELYAGKFGAAAGSAVFRALVAIERLSAGVADHVVVANHLWHRTLVERTLADEKCTVILNYPDLRLFRPSPARHDQAPQPFVMLYPGSLNQHQGVDVALAAFCLALDRLGDAEFHIYGEGPMRESLERFVAERGLEARVKICDRVPLQCVAGLMAGASLGVVPKRADGFGNEAFSTKILEFMACGTPVVVTRTAVDAFYFDDRTVRFVAPGDPGALAEAMIEAYEGRRAPGPRLAAATALAQRMSWQERSGDYLDLVERLTCRQPSLAR